MFDTVPVDALARNETDFQSESNTMSNNTNHAPAAHAQADNHNVDVIETVVHKMPYVLPIAGAVLIFLLAFIAVFMA
jgi:hypothetical protein